MADRKKNAMDLKTGGISMVVKPVLMYEESYGNNYDGIQEGDLVIAQATRLDLVSSTIFLKVGEIEAKMLFADFHNFDAKSAIKAAYAIIGKNVIARVAAKTNGYLLLERKSVLKDTTVILSGKVGETLSATIETFSPFGVFVDIGNGLISLVHVSELSRSRISNLTDWFHIGDCIKVKIMDFDPQTSFFTLSRKQAYDVLDESKLTPNSCIIVTCCHSVNEEQDGVFVEYDPGNAGIVDIPEDVPKSEFYEGRKMAVVIKRARAKGFQARFYRFLSD